jgi:hypothetical protein
MGLFHFKRRTEMKIFEVATDFDNYDVCGLNKEACRKLFNLEHLEDWELYFDFDGSSQSNKWWPRVMERFNEKPKLGDYISKLGGEVIILEKKAIEKLKPLMSNVEILPLICDFGDYRAINVMDVIDCINYEKSDFKQFSAKPANWEDWRPRIMRFIKYEFIKEKIEGYNIFKIIDKPQSAIFVNETFVNSVKEHGITGFAFKLVWKG